MVPASAHPGGFFGPNLRPDTPIYRICPRRHLETLLKGKFVIRSTRTWLDPCEKLISQCCYQTLENGRIQQHFIEKNILPTFGQCWSTCRESDAVWRIYSRVHQDGAALDKAFDAEEAVRLRTTTQKLLDALVAGVGEERSPNCFVAKVRYFGEDALLQEVANIIGSHREKAFSGREGQAESLLFKRDAFAHEQEVRLLYIDVAQDFLQKEQIEVAVDPNSLVEEITIDPRVRGGQQESWRSQQIRDAGFKNEINRSLLYLGTALTVSLFTQEELARASGGGEEAPKEGKSRA
jgi:hypothetical protein